MAGINMQSPTRSYVAPALAQREVRSLVLALQLAVIARTDDRRTWDFVNHTDSKFLDRLREEIESERGVDTSKRQSVGELCRRAHEREPRMQTSDWYLLFSALFAAYKGGRHRKDSVTGNVFMVRTGDLHAVEAAWRNSGSYDLPHPVGGPVYRETFSDDTKSSSAPAGPVRFTEILCKVALNSMRSHLIQQRAPQRQAPHPPQQGQSPEPTPAQPQVPAPQSTAPPSTQTPMCGQASSIPFSPPIYDQAAPSQVRELSQDVAMSDVGQNTSFLQSVYESEDHGGDQGMQEDMATTSTSSPPSKEQPNRQLLRMWGYGRTAAPTDYQYVPLEDLNE